MHQVLLAEDDETIREATRLTLEAHGHRVRTAADGVSGLALFRERRPDVAVLDIIMLPGLNGVRLARRIRDWSNVPHIMGSFSEAEPGVGGGSDTSMELGGSLGIAILGSLLATSYKDKLTDLVGGHLPAAAMDTAKDSVGGGPRRRRADRQDPFRRTPAGPGPGRRAVHESFAHAIAHTSVFGGIIMALRTCRPRCPGREPRSPGG